MYQNDKTGLWWCWVLICVMFGFVSFSYPHLYNNENMNPWLIESLWWIRLILGFGVVLLPVLLLWPELQELIKKLQTVKSEVKKKRDIKIQEKVETFENLISNLENNYNLSNDVLQSVREQSIALADVINALHQRVVDLTQKLQRYDFALAALVSKEELKIAQAAGGVSRDLRILMTHPRPTEDYYTLIAKSIVERKTKIELQLEDYRYLRDDLMVQLTGITSRLSDLQTYNDLFVAVQPLLKVEKEFFEVNSLLKLEQSLPTHLPQLTVTYLKK